MQVLMDCKYIAVQLMFAILPLLYSCHYVAIPRATLQTACQVESGHGPKKFASRGYGVLGYMFNSEIGH